MSEMAEPRKLKDLLNEMKDEVLKDKWSDAQSIVGMLQSFDVESTVCTVKTSYGENEPCIAIPISQYDKLVKILAAGMKGNK